MDAQAERGVLVAARRGEQAAFERLLFVYRRELFAHCYRISVSADLDARVLTTAGTFKALNG